jgi:trehalose-6-phosphate synthase
MSFFFFSFSPFGLRQGATLVNPYDAQGVAAHLLDALTMRDQTKRVRHHTLER